METIELTMRWLAPWEHWRTQEFFDSHNLPVPSETHARILSAWKDDEMVGFVVVQLLPHIEPIWVKPELRGQKIASELVKALKPELVELNGTFYCGESPNPAIGKLQEFLGMKPIGQIYEGNLSPQGEK